MDNLILIHLLIDNVLRNYNQQQSKLVHTDYKLSVYILATN